MPVFVFSDNARSTLGAAISAGSTTITLASGGGARFPAPAAGQQFTLTLNDLATRNLFEVCYCTARVGDVLTVVRGQEGTAALSWVIGDYAWNGPTSGTMAALVQANGNPIYAADTGAVNALAVSGIPSVSAYRAGLTVRVLVGHTNTTTTPTLNVNSLGAVPIVNPNGSALAVGKMVAGHIAEFVHNGTSFDLLTPYPQTSGMQEFLASGSFTVPIGVTKVRSRVWGAGGGGGGAFAGAGSGGGGGGYAEGMYAVTPGQVITVTVGVGGVGGTGAPTGGSVGGTSSFGAFASATGGGGGGGGLGVVALIVAAGGVATGGAMNVGGNGGYGGSNSGSGGSGFAGGAGGGAFGTSLTTSNTSSATGNFPGGGGGGGAHPTTSQAGGTGQGGLVVVEW
jgi:hypothetical protein